MKKDKPPEIPIETLLARLKDDKRLTVSERATLAYSYKESLSVVKIGSIATVCLFAGGALASCFNQTGLTATLFALGTGVGGCAVLAQRANDETVEYLRRDYGQEPPKPKDP